MAQECERLVGIEPMLVDVMRAASRRARARESRIPKRVSKL